MFLRFNVRSMRHHKKYQSEQQHCSKADFMAAYTNNYTLSNFKATNKNTKSS